MSTNDKPITSEAPPPPKESLKCNIEDVLPVTVLELIKLAPNNQIVRAHALRVLQQEIPPKLDTFPLIKEWIEANIERKDIKPLPRSEDSHSQAGLATAFSIEVERTNTEYGRCDYSCDCSDNREIDISRQDLSDAVNGALDNGGGLDDVCKKIRELILESADNDLSPEPIDGTYEYSDHESSGTQDESTSFSEETLRRRIQDYMSANWADQLTQLEENNE